MNKSSTERRRIASLCGATALLSSSSLVLFQQLPHTPVYASLCALAIGLPIGITLILFYRKTRRSRGNDEISEG